MSQLDDLFREGLGARKADLTNKNELWARIHAAKDTSVPEGEVLDETFRSALVDRRAPVPVGMWKRILASRTRRPLAKWLAAAALLLLLISAGGIGYAVRDDAKEQDSTVPTTLPDGSPTAAAETPASTFPVEQDVANTTNTLPLAVTPSTPPSAAKGVELGEEVSAFETASKTTAVATTAADGQSTVSSAPALPTGRAVVAVNRIAVPVFDLNTVEGDLPAVVVKPGKFKSTNGLRGLQTELLFGVSYARQELRQLEAGSAQLLDLREASEFPEFGYQITLRSTYQFTDRLRLLAGLTYAEIRNELDYDLTTNGSTVRVRTNNHIRMLEAPILLGYTVPGKRLNVTVNAGPLVNLTTGVRGRFLDPSSAIPLDLRTEGNFRNNVGIGFMASLTTAYQIGKERPFTLLIEPFFKAYPTAFTVKDAPLREKYWIAGLQLGVRKHL